MIWLSPIFASEGRAVIATQLPLSASTLHVYQDSQYFPTTLQKAHLSAEDALYYFDAI